MIPHNCHFVILYSTKIKLFHETCLFFKHCYCASFHDFILSGAFVAAKSLISSKCVIGMAYNVLTHKKVEIKEHIHTYIHTYIRTQRQHAVIVKPYFLPLTKENTLKYHYWVQQ
jgi:hypothetical protein